MIIEGNSIAECWLKILNVIVENTGKEVSPLIVQINVTGERPEYQQDLEVDVNAFLESVGQFGIDTTANTIFPLSLSKGKSSLFKRFDRIWKGVKTETKNRRGTYFRRFMAYGEKYLEEPVNQLEHIIDTYNSDVHRRSALIATVFDPKLDHKSTKQLGFPCLQQVCFIPDSKNKTLSMNAIYAMQYIDIRAYGNYLGLICLGKYMAERMNLRFSHLQCMLSIAALGQMNKTQAKELVDKYQDRVSF